MGLDQNLYRTTYRRLAAERDFEFLRNKYEEKAEKLMERPKWRELLETLPKNEFGHIDPSLFNEEHKRGMSKLRWAVKRIAKQIGIRLGTKARWMQPVFDWVDFGLGDEDELENLGYWRKNWDLHNYIIRNFWDDPNNDNLVKVLLSKKDLEKIVADGHEGGFKDALDRWDDDHVVFYYPWY